MRYEGGAIIAARGSYAAAVPAPSPLPGGPPLGPGPGAPLDAALSPPPTPGPGTPPLLDMDIDMGAPIPIVGGGSDAGSTCPLSPLYTKK